MSKKIMKRSLVLGALMAFVITGSAWAEISKTPTSFDGNKDRISVPVGETLNITNENFSYISTGDNSRISIAGTVNISGTTFEHVNLTGSKKYGDIYIYSGNLNLTDVTFKNPKWKSNNFINMQGNANITISSTDGKKNLFTGHYGRAIYNGTGNVTFKENSVTEFKQANNDISNRGGNIILEKNASVTGKIDGNGKVIINGGTLNGKIWEYDDTGLNTVSFNGGTWNLWNGDSKVSGVKGTGINISGINDINSAIDKGKMKHSLTIDSDEKGIDGNGSITVKNLTASAKNNVINADVSALTIKAIGNIRLNPEGTNSNALQANADLTVETEGNLTVNAGGANRVFRGTNGSTTNLSADTISVTGQVVDDAAFKVAEGSTLNITANEGVIEGDFIIGADAKDKSVANLNLGSTELTGKITTAEVSTTKMNLNGTWNLTGDSNVNQIQGVGFTVDGDYALDINSQGAGVEGMGIKGSGNLNVKTLDVKAENNVIQADDSLVVKADEIVLTAGGKDSNVFQANADLTVEAGKLTVNAEDANRVFRGTNGSTTNLSADEISVTGQVVDDAAFKVAEDSTLNLTVNKGVIEGNFIVGEDESNIGTANLNLGATKFRGAIRTAEGSTTNVELNGGTIELASGETNITSLSGKDGLIKFASNDAKLAVATNTNQGLKFTANSAVNEAVNGDANKLISKVDWFEDTTMVMEAGDVVGEVTAELGKNEETGCLMVKSMKEAINPANESISDTAIGMKLHWRAHVNDMNKRMGELRDANGEHGVWTRMVRGESEYKNVKAQYNQYQLGYDEKLSVDKRWTVGAAVTFSEGDASYGYGSTEDKSTAFAIYGSKLNNDGTFVDLIARYAHLESDVDDQAGKGSYSANGMSVSAEFGKRIQQGNGLWIEPQAELTYGTIDSAEYKLGTKIVEVGDMDSLIGRVGFRIGKDIEKGNVYARASYLYDFEGETENAFRNDTARRSFNEDLGGGWWEVGVGANINLSKATYIYADVEKTFGGEVDTNWQWNLGVRYSF